MEKNRVVVTIFGREYKIVSEVDPEYIHKAANYVDSKMREISSSYPNIAENKIAILAALNIADELFQARQRPEDSPEVEQRVAELARKLSEVI